MCQIEPAAMSAAEMWIADRRRGWGARLDDWATSCMT